MTSPRRPTRGRAPRKNMANLGLLVPQPDPEAHVNKWATVTDDSPLRITLDGEADELDVTPDTLVGGLQVDDRVWVQMPTNYNPNFKARRVIIIGKSGGGGSLLDGWPVGAIYSSTVSTSPATLLGGGTWTALSNVFLVAKGSGTFATAGSTGGSETSTALIAHTHGVSITSGTVSSDHSHNVGRDFDGGGGSSVFTVHSSGSSGAGGQSPTSGISANHTHLVSGNTGSAGSGSSFSILPPYLVVYMWKRTA